MLPDGPVESKRKIICNNLESSFLFTPYEKRIKQMTLHTMEFIKDYIIIIKYCKRIACAHSLVSISYRQQRGTEKRILHLVSNKLNQLH